MYRFLIDQHREHIDSPYLSISIYYYTSHGYSKSAINKDSFEIQRHSLQFLSTNKMSNVNFIQIVLAIAVLSNIGDAAVLQRQNRLNKCPEMTGKLDLDYNQVDFIHSINSNHEYMT